MRLFQAFQPSRLIAGHILNYCKTGIVNREGVANTYDRFIGTCHIRREGFLSIVQVTLELLHSLFNANKSHCVFLACTVHGLSAVDERQHHAEKRNGSHNLFKR